MPTLGIVGSVSTFTKESLSKFHSGNEFGQINFYSPIPFQNYQKIEIFLMISRWP